MSDDIQLIVSTDIRRTLYFECRDVLYLHTPDGVYGLSRAAGEDLLVNFQINFEAYQDLCKGIK